MSRDSHHPMQAIVRDDRGVIRFRENKIVRWLLDNGSKTLNDIAAQPFEDDDRDQFMQLIGYSVSNAPLRSSGLREAADEIADKLDGPETWTRDFAAGYSKGFDEGRARGIEVAIDAIRENT
jgi:hypothetical protein